jgi:hypothetical protein
MPPAHAFNAPVVGLADPERTYPFRLKEFLGRLNIRLRALGVKPANPYDMRALQRLIVAGAGSDGGGTKTARYPSAGAKDVKSISR